MSMVRYASRVGAALFVLGVSLGGVHSGIAAADGSETASASEGADRGPANTSRPSRATRGAAAAGTAEATRSGSPRSAAVAGPLPGAAAVAPPDELPAAKTSRRHRGTDNPESAPEVLGSKPETAAGNTAASPLRSDPPTAAIANPAPAEPIPAASAAQTPAVSPDGATPSLNPAALVAAESSQAPVASTAPVRATALAALTTPVGNAAAATSLADFFNRIKAFFEGATLLWRRTFANKAPTVNPVQLTGQSEGPITGTIGAVDPEGDPMTYKITGNPQYGSVAISQDGVYTYTPGSGFPGEDSFTVAVTDTAFRINFFRAASTTANVTVNQGELAAVLRFQFVYGAGSQWWSAEARSALESAAEQLASYIVVTSPVTITYDVTGEFSPLSSTLASAGSDFISPGAGFMRTVVQNKILTGNDANGSAADGQITWNLGRSWGFGSSVPGAQYDFTSTAMHELVHTLGFLSYVDKAGSNTGQSWTVFDSFLTTSGGTPVIGGDYKWKTAYNSNLTGGNGGLYFNGPNAVAVYGGLIPLYTPSPWQAGSSLSHLDDNRFTGGNAKMMTAVKQTGPSIRVLSDLELAMLRDLGYEVNPGGAPVLLFVGLIFTRRLRRKD